MTVPGGFDLEHLGMHLTSEVRTNSLDGKEGIHVCMRAGMGSPVMVCMSLAPKRVRELAKALIEQCEYLEKSAASS